MRAIEAEPSTPLYNPIAMQPLNRSTELVGTAKRSLLTRAILLMALGSPLAAQWSFTRIVDTSTQIPNAPSWTFDANFGMPEATGSEVIFSGGSSSYYYHDTGMYRSSGAGVSLILGVADLSCITCGGINLFGSGWHPSSRAFVAFSNGSPWYPPPYPFERIYLWDSGSLSIVVQDTDEVPDIPGQSFSFSVDGQQNTDGEITAFRANSIYTTIPINGVYARDTSGLFLVANSGTAIAGSTAQFLEFFGGPRVAEGGILFFANSTAGRGCYVWRNGVVSPVVVGTALGYFTDADYDGTSAYLQAQHDIYSSAVWKVNCQDGQAIPLYAPYTMVPGATWGATDSEGISASNGKVAVKVSHRFLGQSAILSDLCTVDGSLRPIVQTGDVLDGSTVTYLGMGENAFSGRRIAFVACLSDGSCAIYLATSDDVTPPILSCPGAITVVNRKAGPSGENVFFSVSATDDQDPSPVVSCAPASGSHFPQGTTLVTCTATDISGNQTVCSFPVTVTSSTSRRRL